MAADDLLPSYQFAAVKQRTSPELRKQIQYELILRQQPKQSRMCGVGEKADRRPIDPPPIVQLIVRAPGPKGEYTPYLQNPYYFMHASLVEKDTKEEVHLIKDNKTKATTGSSVSSLYPLKDTDGSSTDSGFFVFPDLSVRMEGTYRLKFCLYEMVGREVYFCSSVISAPLTVYSAKKFPGMEESTALSQSFAEQGLKIRIRKEIRPKKRRRGIHPSMPPSLAIKEEGSLDFQHDSDDNDLDQTPPPLATDAQKSKRRHDSLERSGKNEQAKRSIQAPKRITYPSTPSQSSSMEVESSASSVASHPDSSTHATEITRRSSGSSVGHPFSEFRHTESEVDTHHPSPGLSRRVSAESHGQVSYSMPPPGQPPSNYHYTEYPSHRSSQGHAFAATQNHSDTRASSTPAQGMSYPYYNVTRTSATESTKQAQDSRQRSEPSHIGPPSFDPRSEPYPPEYSTVGYTGSYRTGDAASLAPHDQGSSRRSSADQRHHIASQHVAHLEPDHDDTYGRPYATHPAPPARSSHEQLETGVSSDRPQHFPQHTGQPPSRHYGYQSSSTSPQETSYSQAPVHHHHHHHHYHVLSPYDAPRVPGPYTEVIVSGPVRPSYGQGITSEAPLPRAPSFGSQDSLPGHATNSAPNNGRGGHEAMAVVATGHAKSGLSPTDERVNASSDYFGHRPSNGHDGHRHSGYYYQYGVDGAPLMDPSVPPHHRRALSASAASGPADPSVSLPRDTTIPTGERSARPGPPPHRHSSQGIPAGPQHYPPSTAASPPVHPLSIPKSSASGHPPIDYGHPSSAGPVAGRSSVSMPLPSPGDEANYPSHSWMHTGYKSAVNGEWIRPSQPHLGPPTAAVSHPSASSIAHAGTVAPPEHHPSYGYPSDRRSVGHNQHAVYHSAHSSNPSRPAPVSAPPSNTAMAMGRQTQPPPPPSRGYDSSYTSSPRYPMSDSSGHPGPPPVSSWYETSHGHHNGPGSVSAVSGGGPPGGDGHPSVLETLETRSSGPHILGQSPTPRSVESCVDMPRGYSSRRNS